MLDSSATLAWVYEDETTSALNEIFDAVVANILEMGVRRSRNDAAFRDATITDLDLLPITVDAEMDARTPIGKPFA